MRRSALRSLRVRLGMLLAAAVLVTFAAAMMLTWALGVASRHVERVAGAQQRVEALSSLSARVGDYALIALQEGRDPEETVEGVRRAATSVRHAFERVEAEVAEEVNNTVGEAARAVAAGRTRALAQMQGQFATLHRQVTETLSSGTSGQERRDALRTELDVFVAGFGPALGQLMEQERLAAQEAQAGMRELAGRLGTWALVGVALALAVAAILYQRMALPLVNRISEVATGAEAISSGRFDTRLPVKGGDELSLAMARFNRMAESLAGREARLMADQQRLQQIVDERTAELREANTRLAETDTARRRFFTDVSHELRTPLTVILGEAEISTRTRSDDATLREALRTIRHRAQRLHRRVEDLLRIARSESGAIELDLAAVDVAAVLEEVREGMSGAAAHSDIDLVVRAPRTPVIVEADRDWLRQIVEGLVANAVKHSPPGGKVVLSAATSQGNAILEVSDEGAGIPQGDIPHVFERFYRGSREREGGGFGIGLSLAKWVIERHGGSIGAASGEDPGTRITIRLPLQSRISGEAAQ